MTDDQQREASPETPHELVLTNTFATEIEQVWAAWTEPEQFAAWWHGDGWTTHGVVLETWPAGEFSARQTSPDGATTIPFDGFYRVIERPQELVFALRDSPQDDPRTELSVRLREVDGGTEQEFRQTGVITDEHFEALRAGTMTLFEYLDQFLRDSARS